MILPKPPNPRAGKASCTVTVIIPTYTQAPLLEICLQHLGVQTFRSFEVLVICNGPRVYTGGASPSAPNVRWIELPANRGTAGAFNRGLAECLERPYVFLLNDDTEAEPQCLSLLVKALEDNPGFSMAVPKLLQWSNPSLFDGAGDEVLMGGGACRVGRGQADEGQFDRPEPVLSACGAAALYRRALFNDIGNFDEDYFAYYEDVDLSLRAALRGHRCLYVPNARVLHRGGATLGSTFHPEIIRLTTRNQFSTVLKNLPAGVLARVWHRVMIYQILWLGLAIKKRTFIAWCKGAFGAIALLPRTLGKRSGIMRAKSLSNREMLQRLAESEDRIWRWHSTIRSGERPKLLAAYFRVLGRPRSFKRPTPTSEERSPSGTPT